MKSVEEQGTGVNLLAIHLYAQVGWAAVQFDARTTILLRGAGRIGRCSAKHSNVGGSHGPARQSREWLNRKGGVRGWAKPYSISKQLVLRAWQLVQANRGADLLCTLSIGIRNACRRR